jgi:hypothetical protein
LLGFVPLDSSHVVSGSPLPPGQRRRYVAARLFALACAALAISEVALAEPDEWFAYVLALLFAVEAIALWLLRPMAIVWARVLAGFFVFMSLFGGLMNPFFWMDLPDDRILSGAGFMAAVCVGSAVAYFALRDPARPQPERGNRIP